MWTAPGVARPVSLVAVISCASARCPVAPLVVFFVWLNRAVSRPEIAQASRTAVVKPGRRPPRSVLDRGEHGANVGQAGASSCHPISVGERSGQLRPYVRPVTRRSPLAIMGVRVRVRHQSVWRDRGTRLLTVLPDFDYRVFPITLLRLPAGSVGFAPVACHPTGSRHAAACATAATPPFGR
jgi:hypothetical protein